MKFIHVFFDLTRLTLPELELFFRQFFAIISWHVDVAENLSGPELKSGVWVGYNTK